MKTPSGTFALKLVILTAGVTASIVLVSACQKSAILVTDKPVLILMKEPGVKVRASGDVEKAFDALIEKHGKKVCNVDDYDEKQQKKWHRPLKVTGAVRSEAAGNPAPADPVHLLQKVAFDTLDDATDFLSKIK